MSELIYKSAKQLAADIKEKKISALDVAKAHLNQIEKINPKLNALVQVDSERILDEAKKADAALTRGKLNGPLHGVPFTVKDNFLTKNIITTAGSKAFLTNLPSKDAITVIRLKNAGGILLGKTNLPDFAMCWDTDSTAYGTTNNPHDLKRTVGGSSGGEAAIISAGGSPLGLGNDGGGSIRLPSHYCGIAGYRPSVGLIPTTGMFPSSEGGYANGIMGRIISVGPMARFVEDLIYSLPILAGSDFTDPNILELPLYKKTNSIKDLRIAYYLDDIENNESDVNKTLSNVANALKDNGLFTTLDTPNISETWKIFSELLCADGGEGIQDFLKAFNVTEFSPACNAAATIFPSKKLSINEFNLLLIKWDEFRSQLIKFMQNYDVIITPVTSSVAFLQTQFFTNAENFRSEKYLAAYSLMGWPCVVVRAGTSKEGLPIGVQIVAKYWRDYDALGVAQLIEQLIGGWEAPQFVKTT